MGRNEEERGERLGFSIRSLWFRRLALRASRDSRFWGVL